MDTKVVVVTAEALGQRGKIFKSTLKYSFTGTVLAVQNCNNGGRGGREGEGRQGYLNGIKSGPTFYYWL